jgi:HEPN domain-containing protein
MTAEWVRKAEADYRLAEKLARGTEPFHDQLCFLCEQAVEKFLKGLLEELGLPVPRTHILRDLLTPLLPNHPVLRTYQRGLKFLTRFAVGTRYPGDNATKRQAKSAMRYARRVRREVRSLLGIHPPPRKRSP